MRGRRGLRTAAVALVALALAAAPFGVGNFGLHFLAEILIFGLLVASLDLIFGYAGMHSFGHAAYFGVGAYTAALAARHWTSSAPAALVASMAAAALVAVVTGAVAVRIPGIYFLMLTFSFSQLLLVVAETWTSVTGGGDGITGLPSAQLLGALPGTQLGSSTALYYYVLGVAALGYLLLRRVVRSPFGLALRGIRDSQLRVRSLGYSAQWYKLAAFVLAGAVAGVAGALTVHLNRFVSTHVLSLETSALLLVMLIIGGQGTLWGAFVGAAVVLLLQEQLSTTFEHWQLWLGLIFMLVVYVAPRGLAGLRLRAPGGRVRRDTPAQPTDGSPQAQLVRAEETVE